MSEGDAVALAWTVALCLVASGVLPWSWWILGLPAVYVPTRMVVSALGGALTGVVGALWRKRS